MKYLVFGSLNIDRVYSLGHLPDKGETLSCEKYEIHVGGKGLNQAVSLKKAGGDVYMAGCVGTDGSMLTDYLSSCGVDTSLVKISDGFTGHAVIEVDKDGQNQMVLYRGANYEVSKDYCDAVLSHFDRGDLIMLQYEISNVEYIINKAFEKGMIIALNPSPYVDEIRNIPFEKISYLILNEFEGMSITGETDINNTVKKLKELTPDGKIILTLGADGAIFADKSVTVSVPAFKVNAVDTTGAGDTFTGYFLNTYLNGADAITSLKTASAASAVVVCKSGAAETIPDRTAVEDFLNSI